MQIPALCPVSNNFRGAVKLLCRVFFVEMGMLGCLAWLLSAAEDIVEHELGSRKKLKLGIGRVMHQVAVLKAHKKEICIS